MIKFLHCSISSSSVYLFNNRTVQIQWQRWYKWSWNGNDKADSTYRVTGTFVPTYFRSWNSLPGTFAPWNFRSRERKLHGTFAPWNFRSLEHSLPNAISKTWSFRSPCFKCEFLSKVTRTASCMLNRVYRPTHLMPSHQSHETVPSRNRSRRNQRTPTRGVVDNCPPCS